MGQLHVLPGCRSPAWGRVRGCGGVLGAPGDTEGHRGTPGTGLAALTRPFPPVTYPQRHDLVRDQEEEQMEIRNDV